MIPAARLYGACLGLLGVLVAAGHAQTPEDEAVVARARPAVVTVAVKSSAGRIQGTGILVSADGRLLTAWHVVNGIRRAEARLAEQLPGFPYLDVSSVLALDPGKDLALLKLDGRNLPVAPLGDSDSARVGDPVWILGTPEGVEQTVRRGMLTATPPWPDVGSMLLVTVANLSRLRGTSGGPLLDRRGEVIGIAVAGHDRLLVVPVNAAKAMLGGTHTPVGLDRAPPRWTRRQRAEHNLAAAREAVRLNPELPEAHNTLGSVYSSLGRYADSVASLETALGLDPDGIYALSSLAEAHHHLGRHEAALELHERVRARDPEEARQLWKRLRR